MSHNTSSKTANWRKAVEAVLARGHDSQQLGADYEHIFGIIITSHLERKRVLSKCYLWKRYQERIGAPERSRVYLVLFVLRTPGSPIPIPQGTWRWTQPFITIKIIKIILFITKERFDDKHTYIFHRSPDKNEQIVNNNKSHSSSGSFLPCRLY